MRNVPCLVVDEVDDGVLQHLRGLAEALDRGGLVGVQVRLGNLHALGQTLGKHGRPHSLGARVAQLGTDV